MTIETQGRSNCHSARGASGEIGCHQFLPSTWRLFSIDTFGEVVEQTEDRSRIVALTMIEKWIEQGYSDREIFLIWNQGNPGECKSGVNSHGVAYDSCAYAAKALRVLGSL